jgi:hypothetical protein
MFEQVDRSHHIQHLWHSLHTLTLRVSLLHQPWLDKVNHQAHMLAYACNATQCFKQCTGDPGSFRQQDKDLLLHPGRHAVNESKAAIIPL